MGPARTNDTFAAVDLGSNSFHMVVARLVQDPLHIVDRLRERVALAAGLDDKKRLTDDAQARALACIERFGGRVRGMPAENVRAIGTSTLRIARNARAFVTQAQEKLGHSIEIAPGSHRIKITLPGYKTFETEINPLPKQKVEVKTELVKTDNPLEDPSLRGIQEDRSTPPPPPPQPQ